MNSVPFFEKAWPIRKEQYSNFCTFEIARLVNVPGHYLRKYGKYSKWLIFRNGIQTISETKRREELDMVLNAVFTDPADSSAWIYHKWLLASPNIDSTRPICALLRFFKTFSIYERSTQGNSLNLKNYLDQHDKDDLFL